MLSRRKVMLGGLALALIPNAAYANRRKFRLNPKYAPQSVRFKGYSVGTIVIDPKKRFL